MISIVILEATLAAADSSSPFRVGAPKHDAELCKLLPFKKTLSGCQS
jgi:hypothetical protein